MLTIATDLTIEERRAEALSELALLYPDASKATRSSARFHPIYSRKNGSVSDPSESSSSQYLSNYIALALLGVLSVAFFSIFVVPILNSAHPSANSTVSNNTSVDTNGTVLGVNTTMNAIENGTNATPQANTTLRWPW